MVIRAKGCFCLRRWIAAVKSERGVLFVGHVIFSADERTPCPLHPGCTESSASWGVLPYPLIFTTSDRMGVTVWLDSTSCVPAIRLAQGEQRIVLLGLFFVPFQVCRRRSSCLRLLGKLVRNAVDDLLYGPWDSIPQCPLDQWDVNGRQKSVPQVFTYLFG